MAKTPTTPTDLDSEEAAAAWLYGLPPDSFVDTRNQLVKELRAEGRRDLAALVALLRRPTVLAGELNRVLRIDPVKLEALLDAALDVRDGHQDLLDGAAVDINALQRAHRRAATDLADLAERNHGDIHAILESTSLDESLHDRLRAASFAVEPAPQTGFDLLTPTATVTSLAEARARRDARTAAAAPPRTGPERTERTGPDADTTDGPTTTKAKRARPPADDTGQRPEATTKAKRARPRADDAGPGSEVEAAAMEAERRQVATELVAAAKARELADRRRDAAAKARSKAQDRVATMQAQLEAALAHLDDTELKYETAETAVARAQERLDQAEVVARQLDD